MIDHYPKAALGYRLWSVRHGALYSIGRGITRWERFGAAPLEYLPGAYASCRESSHHIAPVSDCECGWYALHSLDQAIKDHRLFKALLSPSGDPTPEMVIGAVAGSGRIEIHERGWRSERVQILALLRPESDHQLQQSVEWIAERIRVPIFDHLIDLREFSEPRATAIPISARPTIEETIEEELALTAQAPPTESLIRLWRLDKPLAVLAAAEVVIGVLFAFAPVIASALGASIALVLISWGLGWIISAAMIALTPLFTWRSRHLER